MKNNPILVLVAFLAVAIPGAALLNLLVDHAPPACDCRVEPFKGCPGKSFACPCAGGSDPCTCCPNAE
jgi:hypothetical protein